MKRFYLILISILITLQNPIFGNGKIIYMIATPRSSSTAFLRMMKERGDFVVMNEPSLYIFCKKYYPNLTKSHFTKHIRESHEEVLSNILKKAKSNNVFVKDMGFYSPEDFINDDTLLSNKNVHFVFLIRNPKDSIPSFYKIFGKVIDEFSYCIGCKSSYEIYQAVKCKSPNKPVIILSEDLYKNPVKAIRKFCQSVDIPFKKHSLHWKNLGENFTGENEWHEVKLPKIMRHWHKNALTSTGFYSPKKQSMSSDLIFSEIIDIDDRKKCLQAYKENITYYEKFKNEQ